MASAWGLSWAGAWGGSWGQAITPPTPVPTYMRPAYVPDDEQERMTTMQIVMLSVCADLSGLSSSDVVQ
jgi:hypothetical protein